jgi:hypothetical protein
MASEVETSSSPTLNRRFSALLTLSQFDSPIGTPGTYLVASLSETGFCPLPDQLLLNHQQLEYASVQAITLTKRWNHDQLFFVRGAYKLTSRSENQK